MKTFLIVVTLVEVLLLVVVLAGYLVVIAATLRKVSSTLGLVTFGVRAIEKQTEPIGPALTDINGALEQVAAALAPPPPAGDVRAQAPSGAPVSAPPRESSGGGQAPTA